MIFLFVLSIEIGISNVSSLIFAVITDAKLGRAKTIIVGELQQKSPEVLVIQTNILLYRILFIFDWLHICYANSEFRHKYMWQLYII